MGSRNSNTENNPTGFKASSTFGNWTFSVYDGDPPEPTLGHLYVDNSKYYVVDSEDNLLLVVPSGNVAAVHSSE